MFLQLTAKQVFLLINDKDDCKIILNMYHQHRKKTCWKSAYEKVSISY